MAARSPVAWQPDGSGSVCCGMFATATHSVMHRHMTRWLSIKTFVLAVNHFIFVWGRMAGGGGFQSGTVMDYGISAFLLIWRGRAAWFQQFGQWFTAVKHFGHHLCRQPFAQILHAARKPLTWIFMKINIHEPVERVGHQSKHYYNVEVWLEELSIWGVV